MDYLKTYKVIVETLSPVYIGSGVSIGKKEYVYDRIRKKAHIPDPVKLFQGLQRLRLNEKYNKYMLYENKDLFTFFKDNYVNERQYMQWIEYSLDSGDAIIEDRSKKEILTCMKDAYRCPYVPGSSLKGAIRTALLGSELVQKYSFGENMKGSILNADASRRNQYLKKETEYFEHLVFHTLDRKQDDKRNAVNDNLSGLKFSDSKPLVLNDLVLTQKFDVTIDGNENPLNVLRESIKPGVKIEFDMTIDSDLCPYDPEHILKAINKFFDHYETVFLNAFGRHKIYPANSFYLGGGCGYATKTVTYPIFGKKDGVVAVSRIIDNTLPQRVRMEHKHNKDVQIGVSPHMIKCTKYNRELYEMGLCKISIK